MPTTRRAGSGQGERACCPLAHRRRPPPSGGRNVGTTWRPPLPGLETQGLSPGPPQSPAEATPGQPWGAGLAAHSHSLPFESFKASYLQRNAQLLGVQVVSFGRAYTPEFPLYQSRYIIPGHYHTSLPSHLCSPEVIPGLISIPVG